MMPDDLNPIAARIYEELGPVVYDDESTGFFFAHMVEAWTRPMLILEQIARDTDEGPGWSVIFDPERAPALFLDWLSMVVGSIPREGETEEQARLRIKGMTGLRRGSAQAARAAAYRYLDSGDPDTLPYVIFNEREGGNAWRTAIRTLASETPDEDQVRQALLEQKPIGIVMTYDTITDITWDTVISAYDTWAEVEDAYTSWGHVIVDLPTT